MPVGDYHQKYGPVRRRRGQDNDSHKSLLPKSNPPTEEKSPRKPRSYRRTVKRRLSLQQKVVTTIVSLLAMIIMFPYVIHLFFLYRGIPGVTVQGLPIGNLQHEDIETIILARHMRFMREPLVLSYRHDRWKPSLSELGVVLDAQQTATKALTTGKHGNPVQRIDELWTIWNDGIDVPPHLVVDWAKLQEYLVNLGTHIEVPPRNATLSVAGGNVQGTSGKSGQLLLVDETAQDIVAALQTLTPQHIVLRTRELSPTIGDEPLRIAEIQAQHFLTNTIMMTYTDKTFRWEADTIASLLRIESRGNRLLVDININQLTKEVERLAQMVDSGSVEPRLRFASDGLSFVEEGKIGWKLKQSETVEQINMLLNQQAPLSRTIALPVEEIHPKITPDNIGQLGIKELVGQGQSSFIGSAEYRITNILAASARFDGVLIAPGEEFSFNRQLGEVNAAHGFVEGYAVIGNRTQLEWGGGVCQNATTVFRAAFWAGLPITERHAHPFAISWYDTYGYGTNGDGAGMDATIFTGVLDLKFVNDTGHWLLMQTNVDVSNQVLTVDLFGTRPDRTVTFEGPVISNEVQAPSTPVYIDDATKPAGTLYQSDVARNGRDIVITRVITKGNAEIKRETFFTRFKAWPNVFIRGTGQ